MRVKNEAWKPIYGIESKLQPSAIGNELFATLPSYLCRSYIVV